MDESFTVFAQVYDLLNSSHPYADEAQFVESIRKRHGIEGKKLMDVGCGTGEHMKYFREMGYSVTGVDKSEAMLRIAKNKLPRVEFYAKDMRNLYLQETFDQITCLSSAINCLPDTVDLKRTFLNFFRHLDSPGIFVCSLNPYSLLQSSKITADCYPDSKSPNLVRVGLWNPGTNYVNATYLWAIKQASGIKHVIEEQRLTKFRVSDIKKAMEEAGFIVSIYEGFTLNPYVANPVFVGIR